MKIVLVGYGTMGKLIREAIENQQDMQCIGLIATSFYQEVSQIGCLPDVLIDASHPDNLDKIERAVLYHPMPLVIATTGYSPLQQERIERLSKQVPIIQSSNFSIGMTLIFRMLKSCQLELATTFDCDILERHHQAKRDLPSGSAAMLKKLVAGEETTLSDNITIHSLRRKDCPGEHTLIFSGNHETIEIAHRTMNRDIFVQGILKATRSIHQHSSGLYSFEEILFST